MTFEGRVTAAYFEAMKGLEITWDKASTKSIPNHWKKITDRTSPLSHGHGARHAVNLVHAILNYAYALLESQVLQSLNCSGFDPACSFLPADKLYRNSLVYDVMDMGLRPKVDHLVLKLISQTIFNKGMVMQTPQGTIRFNPEFARFICATCRISQQEIDERVKTLKTILLKGD